MGIESPGACRARCSCLQWVDCLQSGWVLVRLSLGYLGTNKLLFYIDVSDHLERDVL